MAAMKTVTIWRRATLLQFKSAKVVDGMEADEIVEASSEIPWITARVINEEWTSIEE